MSLFRAIVFTALLVGIVVGAAVSTAQLFGTSPLILKGEIYQKAALTTKLLDSREDGSVLSVGHDHSLGHDHEEGGWEPAEGLERNAYTVLTNILVAIGYALILTGAMALRGRLVTWREGLLWGLAGFTCVMLAPMLGLPPELPGTPSAPLEARQLWWIATAVSTATSLALLAFVRTRWAAALAALLIVAPHLIGAPSAPHGEHGLAPQNLQQQFVIAAALTSLLFWGLLGSLSAAIFSKLERMA
ncbi:MAG: CbtA family protein [Rhizomicrobium sp.]